MYNIELEYRALINEAEYRKLMAFLDANATDLGEDDKDVFFFILPDKLLKVVDNKSKKTAKLVLKLNRIGQGSDFEEIEIQIDPSEVNKSVHMFKSLGFTEIQQSFQKRHNYVFKGVELAVKYSDNWRYHVELEILLTNRKKQSEAEKQIHAVAEELGLKIMTDDELKEFTAKIDAEHQAKSKQIP